MAPAPQWATLTKRPPGTFQDIHITLTTHTGQALLCGHLAQWLPVFIQAAVTACVHTGTHEVASAGGYIGNCFPGRGLGSKG